MAVSLRIYEDRISGILLLSAKVCLFKVRITPLYHYKDNTKVFSQTLGSRRGLQYTSRRGTAMVFDH